MEKKYVCDVSKDDTEKLMGIFEMKCTLESLARQIAADNDIIKEDSLLYTRLIDDYKKILVAFDQFWFPYSEKYASLLTSETELSIDFDTSKLFVVPKASSAC